MVRGRLISEGTEEGERTSLEVVVPDNQLSKAIGRRGQNVKLASQLTNFKIDVYSESDYEKILKMLLRRNYHALQTCLKNIWKCC